MLSRLHRFHGLGSLRQVYKYGVTSRDQTLAVRTYLNQRRQTYRVAVVISKKIEKSAVTRNRIRRRLYEIIRSYDGQITKPFDIVITVYSPGVATTPAEQLQKQLNGLLKNSHVI